MAKEDEALEDPGASPPLEAFLSHRGYVEPDHRDDAPGGLGHFVRVSGDNELQGVEVRQIEGGMFRRLLHSMSVFMNEKKPSQYSSIAPRLPDGTRAKTFPFNGGGRGR